MIPLQVVKKHYDHFATREAILRIKFEHSEITLHIPVDGLVTKNGWTITIDHSPYCENEAQTTKFYCKSMEHFAK